MRICKIENCHLKYYAREYCHKHYDKLLKSGKFTNIRKVEKGRICLAYGCVKSYAAKGYCKDHYGYLRNSGTLISTKRFIKSNKNIVNSIKNRFYSKVLLPNENGCMEWIGTINKLGYGNLVNCKFNTVHRCSYYLHFGKFDDKLHVLHKCDNRRCCSPEHLFLGTHQDNMKDREMKNRNVTKKGSESHLSKLNEKKVYEIKLKLQNKEKHIDIAKQYNVDKTTITAINVGKNWKHV